MKVIMSHDVDHLTAWEHRGDLQLPKQLIRDSIELGLRYISHEEFVMRLRDAVMNKWNYLESLMEFDRECGVPSTFFFGVENGLGLAYSLKAAAFWVQRAMEKGFSTGVHGIAFEQLSDIRREYERFARITKIEQFGIRMHYLRTGGETLRYLAETGYQFDSSLSEMKSPYKVGTFWEFPVHIMDANIMRKDKRWQNQTLEQVKETTKVITGMAFESGIKYLTVIFHDRYFSDSFRTWKDWYIWLIGFLQDNGIKFIGYSDAIKELEEENAILPGAAA